MENLTKSKADEIWERASLLIKEQLSPQSYHNWFERIKPVEMVGDKLLLLVANDFDKNSILSLYAPTLQSAIAKANNGIGEYELITAKDSAREEKQTAAAPQQLSFGNTLNPKYTFDNYVIGKSNNFAHAAATAVAAHPGKSYNPLFLYSGVGLGKTHLMHAIGNAILKASPSSQILYITSETFTNDLISAIARNTTAKFRERYRNVDVLMIDDIQFIAGKEQTQEEFFHTFNTLYEAGKQIVISSDKLPKDIPTLEERLRSRFEWGLTADISKPDLETRIAILRKKAELEHLAVPDEVNIYIAGKIESNIRELEGCLTRVLAYAASAHSPVTEELAMEALYDFLPVKDPRRITPDLIMAVVGDFYHVTIEDMKSKRRNREITIPRQMAMYLIRELSGLSLPVIGELFARDHTTVLHSVEKMENDVKHDAGMRNAAEVIRKKITESN